MATPLPTFRPSYPLPHLTLLHCPINSLNFSSIDPLRRFFCNMAHKTEKEETDFKVVPETVVALCVKCGVAGSNLCQNCYSSVDKSCRSTTSRRFSPQRNPNPAGSCKDLKTEASPKAEPPMRREVNRCSGCRRKVGLTGFRCRCGELFCSDHRYSDRHDCSFDYKAAGREAIARENPVVKAAKIVKI